MTIRVTPQIICDIIKDGMSLLDSQIWIYNQRREIPQDKKLYVVVGLLSSSVYGNNGLQSIDELVTDMPETLTQYVKESIKVDLFSYTTEAVERYPEVLGSMMSTYAQRIQEAQALKIFPIPSNVNDVSQVEGPSLLNRMSITLQVLRKYDMILNADYYDRITPGYVALVDK
jgi:hypothetical protein